MAATGTPTPNLGLRIPLGTDPASVDDINYNSNALDTIIGDVGETPVAGQLGAANNRISAVQAGLAIVCNGNTHAAIESGQFAYVKNHSTLAEGLYRNNTGSTIAANATLSSSNLTADSSGGLNAVYDALNSKISGSRSADCNVVANGIVQRFTYDTNTLNTPYKQGVSAFTEGWIESYLSNVNYGIQTAYATGNDMYTRVLNNGSWGNWFSVNNSKRLGITINETYLKGGEAVIFNLGNLVFIQLADFKFKTSLPSSAESNNIVLATLPMTLSSNQVIFGMFPHNQTDRIIRLRVMNNTITPWWTNISETASEGYLGFVVARY